MGNRSEIRSTPVTSQLPTKDLHQIIDDPTLGGSITDRIADYSNIINLNK